MFSLTKNRHIAIGILVSVLIWSGVATASPESRALVLQGHGELVANNFAAALAKFVAAGKADPNDAEAAYFEGATLNRLARFEEALARLEKAAAMSFKAPGLAFDMGWAMLRLGRWSDAVIQLESFEKAVPGRGKTSEFLGQAFFGMQDYDWAEAELKEAIQRDTSLKPTALLYLAALETRHKNPVAAQEYLETLQREASDSPIAQIMRRQSEQTSSRENEKEGAR